VPWHQDYHAGTRTKKADGTWKAKPGCNKNGLASYEASCIGAAQQETGGQETGGQETGGASSLDDILKQWG